MTFETFAPTPLVDFSFFRQMYQSNVTTIPSKKRIAQASVKPPPPLPLSSRPLSFRDGT